MRNEVDNCATASFYVVNEFLYKHEITYYETTLSRHYKNDSVYTKEEALSIFQEVLVL